MHVRVFRVYSHSRNACKRLICKTVVVTVTNAHVNADAKPQAPDNFICGAKRKQEREREINIANRTIKTTNEIEFIVPMDFHFERDVQSK